MKSLEVICYFTAYLQAAAEPGFHLGGVVWLGGWGAVGGHGFGVGAPKLE